MQNLVILFQRSCLGIHIVCIHGTYDVCLYLQVLRTFSIEFEKHHINWKSAKYGWLAQEVLIPKELGEKIPLEKLQKMEVS